LTSKQLVLFPGQTRKITGKGPLEYLEPIRAANQNGQHTLDGKQVPHIVIDFTFGQGWMQKEYGLNGNTIGLDINREKNPTIQADHRSSPFPDNCADLVLYDPPFLSRPPSGWANTSFWINFSWFESQDQMRKTVYQVAREILRILKPGGELLFKWGTSDKPLNFALTLFPPQFEIIDRNRRSNHGGRNNETWYVRLKKRGDS